MKPERENSVCEDASRLGPGFIAISDGAGGGGIFADKWARYLVENVPDAPINSFSDFAQWLEGIWNPFYEQYERVAQEQGGMVLNKFYDEGSFATIACAWRVGNKVRWMAYGDSVVFHYNRRVKVLSHSFTSLADFAKAPHLLNWKDEPQEEGFSCGEFDVSEPCCVFACSDALSHYVMMMYAVANRVDIPNSGDKNSNLISMAKSRKVDFERDVLIPLFNALRSDALASHCIGKYRRGLLALDDYSIARLV